MISICVVFESCTLRQQKKWMLLPPHVMPPGIFCDEDEEEVTVPLSLTDVNKKSALLCFKIIIFSFS